MTDYAEKVQRGFAWMLENRPEGLAKINLDCLDMGSLDYCVLGQTGGWALTRRELFPRGDFMTRDFDPAEYAKWSTFVLDHGFDSCRTQGTTYRELTAEWVRVITAWRQDRS